MVNPNNYYTVQGWMVTELGLKGNELAAYAIIYGFSQDGATEFAGSLRYISEWLGCSRPTAIKVLASLTEKGLIRKYTVKNGVDPNRYAAIPRVMAGSKETLPEVVKNLYQGSKETLPEVVKNLNAGGKETLPNNYKDTDIDIYIDIDSKPAVKETRHKYGEYKNVLLTDKELEKLQKDYPDLQDRIENLSEYIASTGKTYKSHYATIRAWAKRDRSKAAQQRPRYYNNRQLPQGATLGPNGVLIDTTQGTDLPWGS